MSSALAWPSLKQCAQRRPNTFHSFILSNERTPTDQISVQREDTHRSDQCPTRGHPQIRSVSIERTPTDQISVQREDTHRSDQCTTRGHPQIRSVSNERTPTDQISVQWEDTHRSDQCPMRGHPQIRSMDNSQDLPMLRYLWWRNTCHRGTL